MIKEVGIIMSGDHPRLILEKLKTMTRRTAGLNKINENPDDWEFVTSSEGYFAFGNTKTLATIAIKCPYGQVGDRLYIKETHYRYGYWLFDVGGLTKTGKRRMIFDSLTNEVRYSNNPPDVIVTDKLLEGWFKRPSMFMFKKDARIWAEITGLRAERVQAISERDAMAEGVVAHPELNTDGWRTTIDDFKDLWDSLNAKRGYGWGFNPWDWPISFKVVK